jgi:MFS family permease
MLAQPGTSGGIRRRTAAAGPRMPPAFLAMNDDPLRTLDRMLIAWLAALGLDVSTLPTTKTPKFAGAWDTDIALFDLGRIASALADRARESARKRVTAGGIAVIAGSTLAAGTALAAPLVLAGAVAIGTGLMFGMAEGFVFDTANAYISEDVSRRNEVWAARRDSTRPRSPAPGRTAARWT